MTDFLNELHLRPGTCFGCGWDNPDGLRIAIRRDGGCTDRLVGVYAPRATHGGFPHIVHGGLQFTALDCMAGWCVFALRAPPRHVPLTKTASMRFLRPVRVGEVSLEAVITKESTGPRDPLVIEAAILVDGTRCSEATFEYVTLPEDRFKQAVGVDVMPDAYRRHFGDL